MPTAEIHRHIVRPYQTNGFDEAKSYTPSELRRDSIANNVDAYLDALEIVFEELERGRVAIYLPNGNAGDAIAGRLDQLAPDWAVRKFVKSTTRIRQFESHESSVLVVRHCKSEAINIHASHLVIVRPDWVNPLRYAQIVGRTLRPLSPYKEVAVHLIVPSGVPLLRAAYAEALRRLVDVPGLRPLPTEAMRPVEYEKADACLRSCGSSLLTAAPPEIFAALGAGFECPESRTILLQLWQSSAATITRVQFECLLGLYPV